MGRRPMPLIGLGEQSRTHFRNAAPQHKFGRALRVVGKRLELRYRRRDTTVVELLFQCHRLDEQVVAAEDDVDGEGLVGSNVKRLAREGVGFGVG